jgi:hypothetical protein
VDYRERRKAGRAMATAETIEGDNHSAFSSESDEDALAQLEQITGNGLNASGFRIGIGVILLVGDSLRTMIVEECETDN